MKKTLTLLLTPLMALALELGSVPLHVSLEGDNGGRLDGMAWSSEMLKEKVYILFYVDPDEKDTNNDLSNALKAKAFDRSKFNSVAIINMAATWLPNFAIASSLEKKQEKFPHTIYVKDLNKILVEKWELEDDSSNVLLFDTSGNLIYKNSGKLDATEINTVIALIEKGIS
ncbi:MAG: YtfJ family protein [Campylobacterota bacterium]|nr:YtfJ family protein [Campylobacterota bacterium]